MLYEISNNRVRSEINGTAYELLFNLTGQKVAITSGGAVVEEDTHLGAAPLAAFFNGSLNFEHQDWLGTERFLTGSDGSPIGNYTSYPFGDGYVDNGVDREMNPDPYHFAGMDHDYESTLDHATFREYASAGGRWLSPDPYGGSYDWSNPQSLNRYIYALNDPLSLSDPMGQFALPGTVAAGCTLGPVGCGVGAVIGVLAGVGLGDLFDGLFGGPSFEGSLEPRPNINGNISYSENGTIHVDAYGVASSAPFKFSLYEIAVPAAGGVLAATNGIGQQVPVHGIPRYGNFCGAGGTGTPINSTDTACQTHDVCFGNLNLNADDYRAGRLTPAQVQGAAACNQQLCNTVLDINRSSSIPFQQRAAGAAIVLVFDLIGPRAAQCHQ